MRTFRGRWWLTPLILLAFPLLPAPVEAGDVVVFVAFGLGAAAALTVALQQILEAGTDIANAGLERIGNGLEEFVGQGLDPFVEEVEAWRPALDGAATHWDGLRDQVKELKAIDEVVTQVQTMLMNMGQ